MNKPISTWTVWLGQPSRNGSLEQTVGPQRELAVRLASLDNINSPLGHTESYSPRVQIGLDEKPRAKMARRRSFTFRISSLFLLTLVIACACAILRDSPLTETYHGSFEVSSPGEVSVYEYFDEPVTGFRVLPGTCRVVGNWVNSGSNHWMCYELIVTHESCPLENITWDDGAEYCSVSGSMTAVVDPAFVRKNSAFPITVPWSNEPFLENMGFLGEYDEFWDMKCSLLMTDYGVVLQAGHGDDGAFEYFLGRNPDGDVCAVRCALEPDSSFWINRYYSTPLFDRLRDKLKNMLSGG